MSFKTCQCCFGIVASDERISVFATDLNQAANGQLPHKQFDYGKEERKPILRPFLGCWLFALCLYMPVLCIVRLPMPSVWHFQCHISAKLVAGSPVRAMNFQSPSTQLNSMLAMHALNPANSNAIDMQIADIARSGYFARPLKSSGLQGLPWQRELLESPASQPPDVGAVRLQELRQADAAAVRSTAQSLRQHGFIWMDFTGDVWDTNGTCMASALEEMGSFLAKHEHGGNSHATEGHFSKMVSRPKLRG